nr:TonB-dependent receptor [Luteimonas sp. XNQY3]
MGAALDRFSTQSGLQVAYQRELVASRQAPALSGQLTWREALGRLLAGTGLSYEFVNATTVVIRAAQEDGQPPPSPASAAGVVISAQAVPASAPTTLGTMTVTGTRIRGGTSPSPTVVLDELRFRQEGFSDLGEVIRSVAQNFGGGQNPGVQAGAALGDPSNSNLGGGSALNLRGLGPDATLTLLNGRRLSYTAFRQAVDISAIPIEAVDRIEIVPDGASAIYGSDAVGGVANVMIKRDFDGVTLGALYGDSSDGGLAKQEFTATAGAVWDNGGLIATFKKSDQDPLYAEQRDFTRAMDHPSTLYNGSNLTSGLVSGHHTLGDRAELRLDGLRTTRDTTTSQAYPAFYTVSDSATEITLLAPSVEFALPRDWSLTVGVSHGKDEFIVNSTQVRYGDGIATLAASNCYCNETATWEIGTEGSLMSLGQRDVRLAAGIGGRRDEFTNINLRSATHYGGEQKNRYVYGELSVPVIGADNTIGGVQRLEFSGAFRTEDYDTFGRITTPKFGVIFDPSTDFTFKATWGRSFKTPTLPQLYSGRITYLWRAQQIGCSSCASDETALMSFGGNPDLKPERARTWTASLAYHPETVPELDAELTYFSIDYTQRVVAPIPSTATALSDSAYAQFIQYGPTVSQQQELIATYNEVFLNQSGTAYDPTRVVAIVYAHNINVARQQANGVDLSASYRLDFAAGQLVFRGGASWLDMSRQTTDEQAPFDLSGTLYFPSKIKGRLGAVWGQGGLSLSLFGNYASGVTSRLTGRAERTGSFSTVDTGLRYDTGAGDKPLSGVVLSLAVSNIFNRVPPTFTQTNPRFAPYDSTNFSAMGRYLTVSASKTW